MTTKVSGKEFSLPYARDVDGVSDSALKVIKTVNDGNKTIHLIEADPIATNDWVIVNAGDKGRILELTGIGAGTSTNDKTTFRDVITAEEFKFSTGTDNQSSLNIDGNTYYVKTTGSDTGSANITWGSSSNYGSAGAATTIFPRVQLKNGEWMSILKQVAVNASTIYALPGNFLLSTYEAGTNVTWTNQTTANSVKIGNINYTLTVSGNTTNANITGALIGTTVVNFNDTAGPAILIEEEKTLADSEGNEIVIPLTTEGTTTVMPAIGSVATTDGAIVSPAFSSLQSNNNKNQLIDIFGTWIERDTSNNNVVTVMYPDEQMYADVLFTAPSATVQAGSSGSGSVQELGSVKVTDSEVSSVSTKSLIVVGGSCVNGVAAKLLGSDAPVCGADFTAKTGVSSGQFLIQSFASPYSGTKVATLVAGYNLQDTLNAATYFRTNKPDTAVGKKFVGTTATSATLVSTTTTA